MRKFTPVAKVKGFATQQSSRLSEKTLKKTQIASIFLAEVASVFIFITVLTKEMFSRNFEFKEFLRQCFQIGYKTLPLISVTGAIIGLVLTIQSRPVLVDFGAVSMLPGMVTLSLIREMGPVITALLCAGKIGSGMGAELGSMKVTEQIEAMEVSSINPMRFLVVTRVLAATLMVPLLVLYADALGILGGWAGANIKGNVSFVLFFSQAFSSVDFMDFLPAVIKSFFFGAAIGLVGCYKGYNAGRGTASVGVAANSAVVLASFLVILIDLIAGSSNRYDDIMILKQTDMISDSPNMVNSNEAVIEINNLSKSFANHAVLKDVTLKLFKGENLVVLGKSGSGKSVLIKCIVRLLNPDAGEINVFGQDVTTINRQDLNDLRKKIGFLFQSGALYDSMTVKQNLEFHLKRIKKGLSDKEIDEKIAKVLENVGLPDSADKMPSELSGGMRKRISLARTIVVDPEIMLYDEPTTELDPVTSDEISLLINEVQEKYKTSSIIITHDIACARTNANRLIMLLDGKNYLEGSLEMFEKSTDPNIIPFFK